MGSAEPHEVRVKLMIPHQGLIPIKEIKIFREVVRNTVRGETLP